MANKYYKLILLFAFLVVAEVSYAQGNSPGNRPPVPPGRAPIDGGVIGLLVLGAGYAIKKISFQNDK